MLSVTEPTDGRDNNSPSISRMRYGDLSPETGLGRIVVLIAIFGGIAQVFRKSCTVDVTTKLTCFPSEGSLYLVYPLRRVIISGKIK